MDFCSTFRHTAFTFFSVTRLLPRYCIYRNRKRLVEHSVVGVRSLERGKAKMPVSMMMMIVVPQFLLYMKKMHK